MASTKEPEIDLNKLSRAELIELINKDSTIKSKIQNKKGDVTSKQTAKQNTPGLGIEFEVYLPAYFALLLNKNPEIKDFKLQSNAQDFGNLDDLLVDITTRSGENLYFAFQLKYKENSSKNLLPTNFEAKGDFNLEKYCEAFKLLSDENRKKYHFILYTNKNFDSSRTNEVHKFNMKQDECCLVRNFFDTSGGGKHLYKFEVNEETEDGKNVTKDDFRAFLSTFCLYTGQANIRDLEKSILDILKHKECYARYIDFFRKWHRGDFIDTILDKKTLNVHLVDILLSPFAINYHLSNRQDENSIFFETMVQQFDITIIDASKQDFINLFEENVLIYPEEFNKHSEEEMIKFSKENKLIDKFAKELKQETKLKLLQHFYPRFIKQLKENLQEYPKELIRSSKEYKKDSEEHKMFVEDRTFIKELKKHTELKLLQDFYQKFIKQLKENVQEYLEDFDKNSEEYLIQFVKDDSKFIEELKEETKLKLLHYFYQKPLILDFNESSRELIYEASKLCRIQENGIKLVILGQGIDVNKFSHLKTFTSLTEVDENTLKETKRRCNLSLQGRNISFEEIFEDDLCKLVTPREIFQMLNGNFSIGEDKEKLPECYIPRTVFAKIFDIESIIKDSPRRTAIIFYCKDEFEKMKTTIQTIAGHEGFSYKDFLDTSMILKRGESLKCQLLPTIILTNEECSKQQFEKIRERVSQIEEKQEETLISRYKRAKTKKNKDCETRKNEVHLFKVLNEKKCLLLISTESISSIENYKSTKMSIDENNIHVFFNNSVNILCAQPGMGKSALMKCLKNKCDPNFWTVRVDLKAHNRFFERNQKIEDVLKYFLELENCQDKLLLNIKKTFLEKRKIVLFLDGLDEVENECIDSVLTITRHLSEMGFRIWLSSRQNLQQKIETYFNIFAIEIDEITEDQQKKYIEERLTSQYNENQIEEIVKKVFNNIDLASNRQILEIPLQLHIISEAFIDDKTHYSNLNESSFVLTKMFEIFFKGKYKHYLAKIELKHTHLLGGLEEQLEKSCTNVDFLSIITAVNNQNKAEFEHLTYAEYFASKFLAKNFDKVRILTEEIFSEKYQNLFFIFNIMLAESSPLHLAIIYKNVEQIPKMGGPNLRDEGGRNILQLAACFATKHPSLECDVQNEGFFFNRTKFVLVKDSWVKHFIGEDSIIKEIIDNATLSSEPFKNDEIFEWNSLDYALAAGALYVVEAILLKFGRPLNFYQTLEKFHYSDEVIAYYSIRFGYHCLLSEILAKKTCNVWSIHSDYLREVKQHNELVSYLVKNKNFFTDFGRFFNILEAIPTSISIIYLMIKVMLNLDQRSTTKSILHFCMLPICAHRTKIVEQLIRDGVNKTVYKDDQFTLLHLAVIHEDTEVVNFLLERGADVNIKDRYQRSPLLLATSKIIDQTQLLLEIEANVTSNINQNETQLSSTINSCYEWNIELMKLLLNKGADIKEIDQQLGEPLIQLAAKRGNFDLVTVLIDRGASWNEETFLHAIYGGNTQIIDLSLGNGVNLSIVAALYDNTRHDHGGYSIKNGADLKFQDDDYTVLHEASVMGYVNLVDDLLNNPETAHLLHAQTKKGATFLHLAVYSGQATVVEHVLKTGIDLNTFDIYNDEYPLHFAAKDERLQENLLIEMTQNIKIMRRSNIIYQKTCNIVTELLDNPMFSLNY